MRMNTYTGKRFDPMQMTPEEVSLRDIAHALSLLCRGGGHMKYFYTVGLHSLNCAREAASRGWSDRLVLACLLHDASEAYLSDIIRPVKVHLSNYLEIEEQIMQTILTHFHLGDLTPEEHVLWHQIDDEMLSQELKSLMNGEHEMIPVPLTSEPDFRERPHEEVEERILSAGGITGTKNAGIMPALFYLALSSRITSINSASRSSRSPCR